jgi:hypothetical protein
MSTSADTINNLRSKIIHSLELIDTTLSNHRNNPRIVSKLNHLKVDLQDKQTNIEILNEHDVR